MSDEQQSTQEPSPEPSGGEEPKLRRRPFGYRKADVREALGRQSAELGAREAELAELRQDVAALWLAFAQHDRMIRRALGEDPSPPPAPAAEPRPATEAESESPAPSTPGTPNGAGSAASADPAAGEDAAIGRQLSDLDDVLAAIELATQTLERTYVPEPTPPRKAGEEPGATAGGESAATG